MDRNTLEARLKTLLPDLYSERYEQVEPVPMRSAGLRYRDGAVAWDEMWGSFCDLAMAGGPPHRGHLLEPATPEQVAGAPEATAQVVAELCRGLHLVTGLHAQASPVPGWVQMYCTAAAMADWLARAITMENVSAHREGLVLSLPAGPAFRLEKEIKNVVTSVAKTTHYWRDHTSEERQEAIRLLLATMNNEAPLLQPPLDGRGLQHAAWRPRVEQSLHAATGLSLQPNPAAAWVGVQCGDVPLAIALMRLLVAGNVLARREDTAVFVPLPAEQAAHDDRLPRLFAEAYRTALMACGRASTPALR